MRVIQSGSGGNKLSNGFVNNRKTGIQLIFILDSRFSRALFLFYPRLLPVANSCIGNLVIDPINQDPMGFLDAMREVTQCCLKIRLFWIRALAASAL
jgi:hypothetical protein